MPATRGPSSYLVSRAIFFMLLLFGAWCLAAPQEATSEPSPSTAEQGCTPNVQVSVNPNGQVTLFAQPSTSNVLQWVRFDRADNAFISINNQSYYSLPFRYTLPPASTQLTFVVSSAAAGASTVHLVATDSCGDWQTFVGAGTGAQLPIATNTLTPTPTSTATRTPTPVPTATPVPPSLSINPTNIGAGARVTVTWSNVPNPTTRDWIGLYLPGTGDTSPIGNVRGYTNGSTSGAMVWDLPYHPAGDPYPDDYEFRMFSNDTYQRIAIRYFPLPVRLSFSPSSFPRRGTTTVTWSGITNPSANDWVGIFAFGTGDSSPLATKPLTGASSGSVSMYIPVNVSAGTYQLRLFGWNSGNQRIATENPFQVTSGGVVSAATDGRAGDPMLVSWAVFGQSDPADWVGLYAIGAPDDPAHELAGTAIGAQCTNCSGSVYVLVPYNLVPAQYEFRLFGGGGFNKLNSSNPVRVWWSTPEVIDQGGKYYKSHVDYEYSTSPFGTTYTALGRWYAGQLGASASWWQRFWVRDYYNNGGLLTLIGGWGQGQMWGNDGWWYYEGGELAQGYFNGTSGEVHMQTRYQDRFDGHTWCSARMTHSLYSRTSGPTSGAIVSRDCLP